MVKFSHQNDSVGTRSWRRGNLPLCRFLYCSQSLRSISFGSSGHSITIKRKYLTRTNFRSLVCAKTLDLTDVSLLPIYTTSSFRSHSSYTPGFLEAVLMPSSVNGLHIRLIGIRHLSPLKEFDSSQLWSKERSMASTTSPFTPEMKTSPLVYFSVCQ